MRHTFKIFFGTLVIGLFILRPVSSYADDNHHHDGNSHNNGHHNSGHHGDSHHHGYSYVDVGFSVWPSSYYYGGPYYPPADEVLVSPPVYQTVEEPPVTVVQPPVVIDNQDTNPAPDSFTINIPNNKGGYTAVTLKKSGNGFIGPQGEFYTEFPKVSQLKVMYGK